MVSEYCDYEDDQRINQIKHRLESKLNTAEYEAVTTKARDIITKLDAKLC